MTGSGTALDPYVLYNAADLQGITDYQAWYEVANNIDCSVIANFVPLFQEDWFEGHFDGKGFIISNLHMSLSGDDGDIYIGLFSGVYNGTITDVHLRDVSIEGWDFWWMGTLIGFAMGDNLTSPATFISDCDVTGEMYGDASYGPWPTMGGLAGYGDGNYTRCWTDVVITSDLGWSVLAGLCGETYEAHWVQCFALGDITDLSTDGSAVCGAFGYMSWGGASCDGLLVEDCYSRCNLVGSDPDDDNADGLSTVIAGGHGHQVEVRRFYSTGANNNADDLEYYPNGEWDADGWGGWCVIIEDCYWDVETVGKLLFGVGEGKTTVQMKTKSTFLGWDIV